MLEAGVEVVLQTQSHDVLKMRVVDVSVHSEQSFEYHLDDRQKCLGKWDAYHRYSTKLPI